MLFLSCIFYAFVRVCLLLPCGHMLLSFVMSNCEVVTFPLVSWVRCGAGLYRFSDLCPLSYFPNGICEN